MPATIMTMTKRRKNKNAVKVDGDGSASQEFEYSEDLLYRRRGGEGQESRMDLTGGKAAPARKGRTTTRSISCAVKSNFH